jgi:uncharacterized protein YdaU (DUF1376 family)
MTEKPLPSNKYILFRITNASKRSQKLAVLRIIDEFFFSTPFGYSNDRFEEELTKAELRRKKALKGANSRWKNHAPSNAPSNAPTNARGHAIHTHRQPQQPEPSANLMQKLGIPLTLFRAFKEMRVRIHRPIAPGGDDVVLAELSKLQSQGEDPCEVLQRAILNSSYMLYPARKEKSNGHESFTERTQRKSQEVLAEIRGNLNKMDDKVERGLPEQSSHAANDRDVSGSARQPNPRRT